MTQIAIYQNKLKQRTSENKKNLRKNKAFLSQSQIVFVIVFFFHHGVRAYIIHIRNILKFLEGKTAIEKKIKESKKEEKESEYFS